MWAALGASIAALQACVVKLEAAQAVAGVVCLPSLPQAGPGAIAAGRLRSGDTVRALASHAVATAGSCGAFTMRFAVPLRRGVTTGSLCSLCAALFPAVRSVWASVGAWLLAGARDHGACLVAFLLCCCSSPPHARLPLRLPSSHGCAFCWVSLCLPPLFCS